MAATDVKDVFVKQLDNGEQWIYKRLCNGDEVAVTRLCNCEGNPDDPGTSPDPIVDTEACRIANGIGSYIQGRANYFATLLGEQPDNDFGSFAVALTWLTSVYGVAYPAQLWDATRQLAVDYNNTDEGLLGDGIPNMGQILACAAYAAIVVDVNGINLSPNFAQTFASAVFDFITPAMSAEIQYSYPFIQRMIPLITLAQYKRVAFEASTVDPIEAGDYDCVACLPELPDTSDCETMFADNQTGAWDDMALATEIGKTYTITVTGGILSYGGVLRRDWLYVNIQTGSPNVHPQIEDQYRGGLDLTPYPAYNEDHEYVWEGIPGDGTVWGFRVFDSAYSDNQAGGWNIKVCEEE